MRLVSLTNVKPGDVLGQNIFGHDGSILLRQGVALTSRYINKLNSMGIVLIYVRDERLSDIEPVDPKFLELKGQAVKSISKVFSMVQYNNTVSLKNTLHSVNDLVGYMVENKDIDSEYLMELKTYDNYTYIHSLNTCVISLFLGMQMNFSQTTLMQLGSGAMLHDIGKTMIPLELLNKKEPLTDSEFDILKHHPLYGYDMVKDIKEMDERSKKIILEHHEKVDGSGYPQGLKCNSISRLAKIVCVSDVYDAIISDRVYRKAISPNEAYEFIIGGAGKYFDFDVVSIFRKGFSIYPLGAQVRLSNGMDAYVVEHNKGYPDRPIVRVLRDSKGKYIYPIDINLMDKLNLCIESVKI